VLPAEEFGAELMLVVARARAAGIDPETDRGAAARRYAEHARRWERSRQPRSSSHEWPETTSLPGSYRRYGGMARFFIAACQPTAKPARLVSGKLFFAFVRLRLRGGWLASLKGRDGLV